MAGVSLLFAITGTFTINFKLQLKVCNCCHNMTLKSMRVDDPDIVTVKWHDYRIIFWT